MFTNINIKDFRALKEKDLKLGKYITMLAGWNATGKSTVLALLANSSELKTADGKTYNDKQFKAEFSEILKGSKTHDKTGSNRLNITWESEDGKVVKTFRTTWQIDNGKNRFRVIPKEIDDKGTKTEAKFDLPVIYLGLSRLYPIGETEEENLKDSPFYFENDKDKEWFNNTYQEVLSSKETITDLTNIDFKSINKRTPVTNTKDYDWITNSSGQDNMGQILFAILSFKKLASDRGGLKGGLLLIDELEASLHPKAQEKIINILIKEAKDTNFQVVFTTHSLTIIEKFAKKYHSESETVLYHYFTRANRILEIKHNPTFDEMQSDLLVALYEDPKLPVEKVVVYSEDAEARWFLSNMIKNRIPKNRLNILNITMGCASLVDLLNCDPGFVNNMVIFDGDMGKPKSAKKIKKHKNNFKTLPCYNYFSPEKTLHEFLFSQNAARYFENEHAKCDKVKIEYFEENDIEPISGDKKERDVYKEWFKKHKSLFEKSKICEYWKEKNKESVDNFVDDFRKKLNKIAERRKIKQI